jgi:hypothetical protein
MPFRVTRKKYPSVKKINLVGAGHAREIVATIARVETHGTPLAGLARFYKKRKTQFVIRRNNKTTDSQAIKFLISESVAVYFLRVT